MGRSNPCELLADAAEMDGTAASLVRQALDLELSATRAKTRAARDELLRLAQCRRDRAMVVAQDADMLRERAEVTP